MGLARVCPPQELIWQPIHGQISIAPPPFFTNRIAVRGMIEPYSSAARSAPAPKQVRSRRTAGAESETADAPSIGRLAMKPEAAIALVEPSGRRSGRADPSAVVAL